MLKKVSLFIVFCLVGFGAFAQEAALNQPQPEKTLAGITVGKSWDHVINLYGQPDEILVGLRVGVTTTTGGFPGIMPGMGGQGMMGTGMMPGAGGMPGMMRPGATPGTGMPGMMGPGMTPGMPGMMGPGMMPGAGGMQGMTGSGMPGMMGSGMSAMISSGMPGMMGAGMGPMPGMRSAGTATPIGGPVGPQGGVFPLPGISGAEDL